MDLESLYPAGQEKDAYLPWNLEKGHKVNSQIFKLSYKFYEIFYNFHVE